MVLEEFFVLVIVMIIAFLFCCFVGNRSFWQGYRNTKFLDEIYNEHNKETSNETNEVSKPTKRM